MENSLCKLSEWAELWIKVSNTFIAHTMQIAVARVQIRYQKQF